MILENTVLVWLVIRLLGLAYTGNGDLWCGRDRTLLLAALTLVTQALVRLLIEDTVASCFGLMTLALM